MLTITDTDNSGYTVCIISISIYIYVCVCVSKYTHNFMYCSAKGGVYERGREREE